MKKEIHIVINKESWEFFFKEISKDFKFDYKKVHIKLSDLYELKSGKDIMKIGVILKIKKVKSKYYSEIIFGIENDKNLSIESKNILKSSIEKFLTKCKNDVFFENHKNEIIIDFKKFIETGCGVIDFDITIFQGKSYYIFQNLLENIYTFLYFDLLQKQINEIIVSNPIIYDYEKETEIPYWLEGYGLENNNTNKTKKQKIERISFEDMGGNKDLKIEIGKLISSYKNNQSI